MNVKRPEFTTEELKRLRAQMTAPDLKTTAFSQKQARDRVMHALAELMVAVQLPYVCIEGISTGKEFHGFTTLEDQKVRYLDNE